MDRTVARVGSAAVANLAGARQKITVKQDREEGWGLSFSHVDRREDYVAEIVGAALAERLR